MKRFIAFAVFFFCLSAFLSAQRIKEMEFKNQAIADILLALGQTAGRSIVPDETVSGTASYYFTETDFETALSIFLSTYRMYFWREANIYYVSRVRAQFDKDEAACTVDADDVSIRLIVRALSRSIGKTILFDALPQENITLHVAAAPPSTVLEIMMRRFPDYKAESNNDYFYIRKLDTVPNQESRAAGTAQLIKITDGKYAVDIDKTRLRDLLNELFRKANVEYSLFLRSDLILENVHFSGKSFEELLHLLLEQANADFSVERGIYYVFDIQRADVLKKLKTTRQIQLTYLSVQDLPNLFPQEMASQNLYRLDRNTNTIILTGSDAEIGPIGDFITRLDQPTEGKAYCRFDLSFIKVSDIPAVLPPALSGIKPIPLPQGNSFVMLLSPEGRKLLDQYLPLVDRKQPALAVQLKYIQSDYLLKNLPPSVSKDDVQATGDSTLVFFTGSEERRRQFLRELSLLDRPIPQIRYELLVVQYQNGSGLNWEMSITNSALTSDGSNAFLGSIGKLLQLNFDIVSTFGYLFAIDLNLQLTTNKASVLADTTLNGLSGQDVKFQNTETSRYRELETDPDTGKTTATGVTREITTGLIISTNGWVSGDGMITMKVSSTVSKQGADTTSTTGVLPTTSEKIVSTNVRTPSGKPVVIGGLLQQNKESTIEKVPVLGDIPLLGWLFQKRVDSDSNTELVIYIVPHVEYPDRVPRCRAPHG